MPLIDGNRIKDKNGFNRKSIILFMYAFWNGKSQSNEIQNIATFHDFQFLNYYGYQKIQIEIAKHTNFILFEIERGEVT